MYSSIPPLSTIKVSPDEVKGIHITSSVASNLELFKQCLFLADRTELNAVVIDIKETDGVIAYNADIPLAREIGAIKSILDIDEIIRLCNQHRLYKIARVCVFKDNLLAQKRPDMAIVEKNGKIWSDFKGCCWTNPYSRDVWEYNRCLAKDLSARGFDEIQFDYLRFPTDGRISNCWYGAERNNKTAMIAISDFVKFCKQGLEAKCYISVDVFGLSIDRDLGIGQNFIEIAKYADFISPMVYPSHYYRGEYGLIDPDAMPYDVINFSTKIAMRKLEGTGCKLRSWLQDFSLKHQYGPVEVQLQIKALSQHGCNSWLLWNPFCRYTEEALMPDEDADRNGNFYIPSPSEEELLKNESLRLAGLSTISSMLTEKCSSGYDFED
ncbi:MAG: putative glycoside hydrolase [bacterium]